MKRLASILGVVAVLAAPSAHAQFTQNYISSTNFSTTGSTERGLAYGVVGGNQRVYITKKSAATSAPVGVYIYDANTGAFQTTAGTGSGSLDLTGITTAIVDLQDIEVSDDGLIYGCNLSTSNTTGQFKCYNWATEAAAPQVVTITGLPATAVRFGDKIRVTGSLATGLYLWLAHPAVGSPVTTNAAAFRCTASDALTFSCTSHDLSAAGITTNAPTNLSVSPAPGSITSVWLNANGINPRLITLPAAGSSGAAQQVNLIPGAQINGTGNNSIVPFLNAAGDSSYVAIFEYSTSAPAYARGRIVNVTTLTSTSTAGINAYGVTPSVSGVSASGLGDIAVRENGVSRDIFVLGPNGGFGSFSTTKATLPVELTAFAAHADGATARFTWSTASETNNALFALEQRTGNAWAERYATPGRGTTSERSSYTADIAGLAAGRHTFRLRQTDLDGTSTVAGTVTVEIAPESGLAIVLLGDGQGGTNAVRIASRASQPVTAHLYDVTGRQVALLVSGATGATVDAALPSGLAAGVYVVRVVSGTAAVARTLVVR